MTDSDKRRAELESRKVRIAQELAALTEPPETGVNLSFGKRVGDGTTEAVERIASTATARSLATTLAQIDRALAKIDEGTYGICDDCGKPIPEERLNARPATARCVECSARH
ncbi:MAG: TraR/DksA C4-type zinc finger protein [Acidimicrobiia bacterium]